MAFAIGDIIEHRVVIEATLDIGINVRHFVVTSFTAGPATEQATSNGLALNSRALYRACIPSSASWKESSSRRIWPLPQTAAVFSTSVAAAGTAAGGPMPPQATGVISLRTGLIGVAERGRVYVPFPSTSFMDGDGEPDSDYVVALNSLGVAIGTTVSILVGATDSMILTAVLYHPLTHTTTPITSTFARDYWGTQRRRNNKRF